MTVGIITFHYAHNYGAMLQSYALLKFVESLGYEAKIVNFYSFKKDDSYTPVSFPSLSLINHPYSFFKGVYVFFREARFNNKSEVKFNLYEKFLFEELSNEKEFFVSGDEIANLNVDAYICGSDQIWNPDITVGLRKEYFADFNGSHKRIAYAASCGDTSCLDSNLEFLKNELISMNNVSVRESSLKDYLNIKINYNAELVIDPTLLIDSDIYKPAENNSVVPNEKYILVYNKQGKTNKVSKVAKKIAKIKKMNVIEISERIISLSRHGYKRIIEVGPAEYLALYRNAEYVVTDAFHGVAFALVFQKDFNFVPGIRFQRIYDLLDRLSLTSRIVATENIDLSHINFDKINVELNKMREASKDFILNSLS